MIPLVALGIVILGLSIAGLVFAISKGEIWTMNNGNNTMNAKATAWDIFCFGGGLAGLSIGPLCIIFGLVWGCVTHWELKRREKINNGE